MLREYWHPESETKGLDITMSRISRERVYGANKPQEKHRRVNGNK
jgi:hypothetical protein